MKGRFSKRMQQAYQGIDRTKRYPLEQSVALLRQAPKAKFDESVDLAFHLGVDVKQTDQMVRGVVQLPHGTGQTVRVVVVCKGELEKVAKQAGADEVGAEDLIKKIEAGWLSMLSSVPLI
jgi:large subunit ribosomal protein L1